MKCPSCNRRKGKRYCPGLRQTICSVCCGEKRLVEIPCPSDCPYLVSGSQYQGMRHYEKQLRGPDATLFEEVLSEKQDVLQGFHEVLVRVHRLFRNFTDKHALVAVQKVRQTCETESKGVIYEHRSPTPHVQVAIKVLQDHAALLRRRGQDRRRPARLSDVITCLKFLEKDIAATIETGDSPSAYLSFIATFFPQQDRPSSSIILP